MSNVTVVGSDFHAPYHCEESVKKFVEFVKDEQPPRIVLLGDLFDCYQISRFNKDPRRLLDTQKDIDVGTGIVADIRHAAPHAEIIVVEGNHEFRLSNLLMGMPELSSLRGLSPLQFFGLDKLNVKWADYKKSMTIDGVRLVHGHIVRKRAGYTAHGMLDTYLCTGMSGHTHRLALIHRVIAGNCAAWAEIGCLCSLDAEYMHEDTADWQNGFAVIHNGQINLVRL